MLEAKRFPRDKICGDGLIPDSLALLREMGLFERVEAEAHRATHVRVLSPNGNSVALAAPLLTLRRLRLDAILASAAKEAGAELLEGHRVREPIRDDDKNVVGVRGQTDEGREVDLRAPITILATGAASQMLAAFGVQTRSQPSAVAMRAYYQTPHLDQNELLISYEKPVMPGYGWVFPMGNGQANVGVGLFLTDGITGENLRELFERFLAECPHVRGAMQDAKPLGRPKVPRCVAGSTARRASHRASSWPARPSARPTRSAAKASVRACTPAGSPRRPQSRPSTKAASMPPRCRAT